jgi:hypothetical protein
MGLSTRQTIHRKVCVLEGGVVAQFRLHYPPPMLADKLKLHVKENGERQRNMLDLAQVKKDFILFFYVSVFINRFNII